MWVCAIVVFYVFFMFSIYQKWPSSSFLPSFILSFIYEAHIEYLRDRSIDTDVKDMIPNFRKFLMSMVLLTLNYILLVKILP